MPHRSGMGTAAVAVRFDRGYFISGDIRFEGTLALVPTLGKEVTRWSAQVLDTIDYCVSGVSQ